MKLGPLHIDDTCTEPSSDAYSLPSERWLAGANSPPVGASFWRSGIPFAAVSRDSAAVSRDNAAVESTVKVLPLLSYQMEDPSKVVLTKEQAELLLPLLPTLQQQSNSLINGSKFTVTDMFERRKGRATQAQNYLLVI